MIVNKILPQDYLTATTWLFLAVVARLLFNRFGRGLNHIPGPWLASCTDIYRFCVVLGRRPDLWHIQLHEKYGKLVRIGPRCVSVSDPDGAKVIYALNSGFTKSEFYPVQQTIDPKGRPLHSMFNTTNEAFHARLRKSVSNAYAMSTLVQFQPLVDSTTVVFLEQLQQRFADKNGAVCDFGTWLQYYAFDVIGELTYSRRLGFVDRGQDVDRIIGDLEWLLNYVAPIGQLPFLDKLLLKNPLRLWLTKIGLLRSVSPVAAFARRRIAEVEAKGQQVEEKEEDDSNNNGRPRQRDFLSRFQEAHKKDPDFISEQRVLALTVANMFAGSDTTAISLRTVFYQLLKQPALMARLVAELTEQKALGKFTRDDALVEWDEVRQLPYLGAVIKEALRFHPAAGLPLERVVPQRGATICGETVPGGTIVGCSAWVLHRDERVFGAQPEQFRPERWLECPPHQQSLMNNTLFAFGAGARTCIGKNIALLEMYKLVPAVLRTFEIELVDADTPLKFHNAWFVKQSGFKVRFKKRNQIL